VVAAYVRAGNKKKIIMMRDMSLYFIFKNEKIIYLSHYTIY